MHCDERWRHRGNVNLFDVRMEERGIIVKGLKRLKMKWKRRGWKKMERRGMVDVDWVRVVCKLGEQKVFDDDDKSGNLS